MIGLKSPLRILSSSQAGRTVANAMRSTEAVAYSTCSPLWQILVDHLETFVATYDSRFVDAYGPLKPYAEKAFGSLLLCGDPS